MIEIALGSLIIVVLVLALSLVVLGARAFLVPAVPVEVSVNGRLSVAGTTGRKLLSLLNEAQIRVPSACAGAGTCGLCRVKVTSGGGMALPTEQARLTRADLDAGGRLACQVVVRGPLAVTVPDAILAAKSWRSTVVSNRMVAPLIRELVLKVPPDVDFDFEPGAYVQLEAPPYALDFARIHVPARFEPIWAETGWRGLKAQSGAAVQRAYSVASRPQDRGQIVLNIRLAVPPPGSAEHVPPGLVSSYLFSLDAGHEVAVAGPFGDFRVQKSDREMVFIGGGVGMAPLRAMIHAQLAAGSKRKMSFWYGARSGADVFYAEEFDALAQEHQNFAWTLALSEPAPEDQWTGPTGFIHDVVWRQHLENHPAPEACEFYLCGPPLMIQAVLAMLEECGVEPQSIFNDDFGI